MKLRATSPYLLREIGDFKIILIGKCYFVVDRESHLTHVPSLKKAIEYSYTLFSDEINQHNRESLNI
jgi:hypothetical protein